MTHQRDNAVPHLKNPRAQILNPFVIEQLLLLAQRGSVQSIGHRFQSTFEVGDGHADFINVVVGKSGGQLDVCQRGTCHQPDHGRMLGDGVVFVEHAVHMHSQRARRLIERMIIVTVGRFFLVCFVLVLIVEIFILVVEQVVVLELILGGVLVLSFPFGVVFVRVGILGGARLAGGEEDIQIGGPILAVFVEEVMPAHLPGDDLVAIGIIQVLFEQFHVFFSLAILLLEEAFPVILIPHPFPAATRLEVMIGHKERKLYPTPGDDARSCRSPSGRNREGFVSVLRGFAHVGFHVSMKLLLIDGSYYAYRSFHAIRGLTNSRGEPTNAIFGFAKTVRRMIKDLRPDLAAVCWDQGLPSRRTELQPEYKQHRSDMPPEMVPQIPFIRDLVPKLGLHGVGLPDTEADDLMASYSCAAHSRGMEVILATNDKDLLSLVEDDILVYSTAKADLKSPEEMFTLLDPEAISKKWGVAPARILDVLALSGDASDNIAGIAGVGPKTATTLIQNAGTLDALLTDLDTVKNEKLRTKLTEGRAQILQNREMVRLDTDLPLPVPLDELVIAPRYDELIEALEWCEFRSLLAEVRAEKKAVASGKPAAMQDDLFPF